jgi:hypothetical protein
MRRKNKYHYWGLLAAFILGTICLSCNSHDNQAIAEHSTGLQGSEVKILNGLVRDFFNKYKTEGADKSLDYIFSSTKSVSGIENLKVKLDSVRSQIGEFTGYSQVAQKSVGDGMVLLSYLVKHKNNPLRFTFIYYKPEDHWVLYKFYFDTDLVEELEYSGKLYFINEGVQ